jgi:hypothetical protein
MHRLSRNDVLPSSCATLVTVVVGNAPPPHLRFVFQVIRVRGELMTAMLVFVLTPSYQSGDFCHLAADGRSPVWLGRAVVNTEACRAERINRLGRPNSSEKGVGQSF